MAVGIKKQTSWLFSLGLLPELVEVFCDWVTGAGGQQGWTESRCALGILGFRRHGPSSTAFVAFSLPGHPDL